ncbi:monovalent cation:proton antiporter-2 (CPA2) family protein [Acidocella aminolytica]|uniref:Sodium/hydrogen exchanger/glutathione-regulated potassium-efflux system protein KefB n=1 Tax=Acidocella aminolytica 101 = DSM 11237 TaxID=1120923 RepID=A0A0D6PHF3_9PROT|nr:monovalent cation:proton antiporter-2 (CPA2) family protein [Acidocella aminolytica]GAN80806.1 sodium/hydrogen exchanger/glutathione-regulated potassium-efflux system protein KefB [Acidocella aminolytica 101 = DSM 11237]GBQ36387.1 putative transporter [Acidocella aminolytica 101 = DSM 11237]SHE33004.1 Kef-type potassium/proton antiporter, CPA2 family (TC 2.A.37.1) [Acidocella aminolytica 101 = DSM 11237]
MLLTLLILLAAIVLAVPLSRYAGLGSILGYLAAGVVIGPSVLGLVTNVNEISDVAEFGVTMLLFLIGLELRPHRLWVLRKAVFGLGLGQMVPTAFIIACLLVLFGVNMEDATVLGIGLALSSTAIALPLLSERNLLPTIPGRDAFAVLLFQDMAAIPALALLPILAGSDTAQFSWDAVARGAAVVVGILAGGTLLVPYVFRMVAAAKVPEVFTATALLLVVGTATLAHWAGLSPSLGAFMAGVMVSDSDYRHEVQADIEPFEGLLLGFFFISVGMSADLGLLVHKPLEILAPVLGLVALKTGIAFAVSYVRRRLTGAALRFSLVLSEGSEFGFVLFTTAVAEGTLDKHLAAKATLVIALSMMVAPILLSLSERFVMHKLETKKSRPFDKLETVEAAPVIICGFGRMGQIIGRILAMQKINFTALDRSAAQVDFIRRFGVQVFYGDPTREELMRAAGLENAKVLVIALDDFEGCVAVAEMVRRKFPHVKVVARARNRRHVHLLMSAGVDLFVRETFFSSLRMTEIIMEALEIPEARAKRAIEIFRKHDDRLLHESYDIGSDETKLIQTAQEATKELQDLFETDKSDLDEKDGTATA